VGCFCGEGVFLVGVKCVFGFFFFVGLCCVFVFFFFFFVWTRCFVVVFFFFFFFFFCGFFVCRVVWFLFWVGEFFFFRGALCFGPSCSLPKSNAPPPPSVMLERPFPILSGGAAGNSPFPAQQRLFRRLR